MRSMALVVLALAGLAWSKTREPVDPGTVTERGSAMAPRSSWEG